jgi:hypothetical protein
MFRSPWILKELEKRFNTTLESKLFQAGGTKSEPGTVVTRYERSEQVFRQNDLGLKRPIRKNVQSTNFSLSV